MLKVSTLYSKIFFANHFFGSVGAYIPGAGKSGRQEMAGIPSYIYIYMTPPIGLQSSEKILTEIF